MTNKFYFEGDRRAAGVDELFAFVASRYDLMNDVQSAGLHRLWKRRLIRLANVQAGELAVDLCCGTGDLSFGLARRGAKVVGVDFNEQMLGVAERRRQKQPHWAVQFVRGDAMRIPFRDEAFDVAVIGYGLRNLASWEKGLQEMLRVVKPRGRVLALEFGKPDNPIWRQVYFGYLRFAVPVMGKVFCGDSAAYAYILESLQRYPAQHVVADRMRQLGFQRVQVVNLLGGIMSINYGERAG
jgi:demethylmenaquinone methyltransferase / 2-methoxy-6-polyprenyl-1,4-benzoquinol methylase